MGKGSSLVGKGEHRGENVAARQPLWDTQHTIPWWMTTRHGIVTSIPWVMGGFFQHSWNPTQFFTQWSPADNRKSVSELNDAQVHVPGMAYRQEHFKIPTFLFRPDKHFFTKGRVAGTKLHFPCKPEVSATKSVQITESTKSYLWVESKLLVLIYEC